MFKLKEDFDMYDWRDEVQNSADEFLERIKNSEFAENYNVFSSNVYKLFIMTIEEGIRPFLEDDVIVTTGSRYSCDWMGGYAIDSVASYAPNKVTFFLNQKQKEIFIWFPENIRTLCSRIESTSNKKEAENALYFLKTSIQHITSIFQYQIRNMFFRTSSMRNPINAKASETEILAGALQAIMACELEKKIDETDEFFDMSYPGRDIVTTGGTLGDNKHIDTVMSLFRPGLLSLDVLKAKSWDYYKAAESIIEFTNGNVNVFPVIQFDFIDDSSDLVLTGKLGAGLFSYCRSNRVDVTTLNSVMSAIDRSVNRGVVIDTGGLYTNSFKCYISKHGGLLNFPGTKDTFKTIKGVINGSKYIGRPVSNSSYVSYDWANPFRRLVDSKSYEYEDEDERD